LPNLPGIPPLTTTEQTHVTTSPEPDEELFDEDAAEAPEETPFDLDLSAEVSEIDMINVKTGPDEWISVPKSMDDWTGNAIDLFTEGKYRSAMEDVVSDVDGAVDIVRRLTMGQITKILEHVSDLTGVGPGESNRSARRSRSTATKRKRTSSRSTR
jgi:hypothetical protein